MRQPTMSNVIVNEYIRQQLPNYAELLWKSHQCWAHLQTWNQPMGSYRQLTQTTWIIQSLC